MLVHLMYSQQAGGKKASCLWCSCLIGYARALSDSLFVSQSAPSVTFKHFSGRERRLAQ